MQTKNYVVILPTGVKLPTNSKTTVHKTLKTWGVQGIKRPPARLNQDGEHEFVGSGNKTIKVIVS